MQEILVTVYCPTYNHEKYIRNALNGFVMQKTTFPFEVIVHDDASTDGTAEIIREYETKYPKIIKAIYQKENQYSKGKEIFYEFILPIVHGKYMASCEGDDYWTDEYKLQKQFEYMESHPECSLVAHEAVVYDVKKDTFCNYTQYDFSNPLNCELSAEQVINDQSYFPTAAMFFRTNYTIINKDFLCSQVINFDYVTKIMLATEGMVHVIPEVMSVYRKGVEGSWTERVMYAKDKAGIIKHFDTKIKNLEEINAYRNYKYDAEIKNKILELKFLNRVYLGDKKVFKDAEFAGFIAQLNRKRRYKLYVQLYFPNLYRWLIFNLRPIIKGNLKCQIPTK